MARAGTARRGDRAGAGRGGAARGRGRVVVAALLAVLALAAAAAVPARAAEGDWRLGYDQKFDSLNPFAAQFTSSYTAFTYMYDWLLNIDVKTGGPDQAHSLATSWETSPDGKVWTYHLVEGAKWSDGQPFTADDVVWTYEAVLNSDNVLSGYLPDVTKVEAPDPGTVRITLSKPNARMTAIAIPILPKHVWGKADLKKIKSFDPGTPTVGTGPFQITKLQPKGVTEFAQNANFREPQGAVKRILFIWYGDKAPELRDIQLGKLDAILSGEGKWVSQIEKNPKLQVWAFNAAGFTEIAFNSCPPAGAGACTGPGKDVKVKVVQDPAIRQAVSWGIDREDLVKSVYSGVATPGNGIVSPNFVRFYKDWSSDPDVGYHYDPEKAKQILADGGWQCPAGGICTKDGVQATFTLLVRANNREEQNAARRMAETLKAIGIQMKISVLTEDAINNEIYASGAKPDTYAPTYDAFLWGWGGDVATPDFNFEPLETGSGWTDSFYSNPAYDKVAKESLQTIDETQRAEFMHEAEKIALTDLPYVFIVHDKTVQVTNTQTWHGYQPSPDPDGAPFWNSWVQILALQPGPAPAEPTTSTASGDATAPAATGGAETSAAAATGAETSAAGAAPAASSGGGTSTGTIVAIVAAAFVLGLGGAVLILRRGRREDPMEWPDE